MRHVLITFEEAAKKLEAGPETVRWLISRGILDDYKTKDDRTLFVTRADVERVKNGGWRQARLRQYGTIELQEHDHQLGLAYLDRFLDCGSKRLRISKETRGAVWFEARRVYVESGGKSIPLQAYISLKKREAHEHGHPSGEDQLARELLEVWRPKQS